mmetsp:Transcript_20370/g.38588  ORF Transcript_20370/g.38588 Transcript_20370/m.38588 type:complete len:228 (-) Transcript_20370:66-749(-)
MLRLFLILLIPYCWIVVHAEPPSNDVCENAIVVGADNDTTNDSPPSDDDVVLLLEQTIAGSTVEALHDGLNLCGENLITSPGLWYQIVGPDDADFVAHVSTCTATTTFDTALTVYQVTAAAADDTNTNTACARLQCLDGRDDDAECDAGSVQHSTVAWQATAGTSYYVLVHGSEANHTGEFGLRVTLTKPLSTPTGNGSAALRTRMGGWMSCLLWALVAMNGMTLFW